jgi:N-acetylglucosaminyl-diphospho-decaprenol L-rhamnosyltransferase
MTGKRVAAVVVDYDAAETAAACVSSLLAEQVAEVLVVENGDPVAARRAMAARGLEVALLATGRNLGYGAGANRGVAATTDTDYVLVANPDLVVHIGAVAALVATLDADPACALVGPLILDAGGVTFPSVRRFPSMLDAVGHAALGLFRPDNPFSNRYRPLAPDLVEEGAADWVSGACFLVRRQAFEELGGFDESYFMFAEDMDLCWRAHRAGWGVRFQPAAVVTHAQGVSRRRHPYRMLAAHHRSALRFAVRTNTGWRRAALPGAAAVLACRLAAALAQEATRGSS